LILFLFRIEKSWERPWFSFQSPAGVSRAICQSCLNFEKRARALILVDGDTKEIGRHLLSLMHQLDIAYTRLCMLNAGLIKLWTEMRRKLNLWKKAIDVVPPRLDFLHFEFPGWCQRNKERPFFPTRIDRFYNGKERKIKVSTVWDEIENTRRDFGECNASWSSLSLYGTKE
jgi:hypothetical protein